jgi:hypothetical protein
VGNVSDLLNDANSKYFAPSEHLAVDEVTVIFKGRVIFKQYIPKKNVLESKFMNYVTRLAAHMTWESI